MLMPRIMEDSVNTANFTPGADIYAGYVLSDTGHGYNNYASMVARFPNSKHLMVCTRFNATADCLDYEGGTTGTGSGNAQQAVDWTVRMRAQGRVPWNYCNQSTWPELRAAYSANEVAEPIWWIANTNTGPVMIPGADAHQYTFNLPRNPYDTSIVADHIPGFDDGLNPSGGGTLVSGPTDSSIRQDAYLGAVDAFNAAGLPSVQEGVANTRTLLANLASLQGAVNALAAAVANLQPGTVVNNGPASGTYTFTPEA